MKRWAEVFRALANVNRLKIIELLIKNKTLNVSEITSKLQISFKATSNHLTLLKNVEVIESEGRSGHVYYSINPKMPKDFQKIISGII